MDFAKPQLEHSGLRALLCELCCIASQHEIELRLRLSQEDRPMHASQHCTALRSSGRFDLVSQLRIETFSDCCRVAAGLAVPWVLCLGHKLGVITQSHSQTVNHTLGTADVILDPHALISRQLRGHLPQPLGDSGC